MNMPYFIINQWRLLSTIIYFIYQIAKVKIIILSIIAFMAGIQALSSGRREYSQSFLESKLLLFSCRVWLFVTPWTATRQASLSFTISQCLLKLMSLESVMPSNHFILCQPILSPTIFPSIIVFSSESALYIKWPKY